MPNAKGEAPGENARKRSWKRIVAASVCIGSRRFSGNRALTFPCRIWCVPYGVLSTTKSGPVRGHPRRAVQRVPWQRNAIRNRLPLKKRSQRLRSRTRFLNNPLAESRRRNLRSNCGLRATWPRRVCRPRGRWNRFASQERLSKRDPLQRRGLKPKRQRLAKKAREEELAKERRRAGRAGRKPASAGSGRGKKERSEPGR
jgi:hypothetical protein